MAKIVVVTKAGAGIGRVKWVTAIEFVHDFVDLDAGQGCYNEDHEFYCYRPKV